MKKIAALFLALVMLLGCTTAFAATPVLGTAFNFTVEDFKPMFDAIATASGMNYTWEDDPRMDFGYPMYVAGNADQTIFVSVHDINGILAFEIDCFVMAKTAADIPQTLMEEFGATMSCVGMPAFMLEGNVPDDTFLKKLLDETTALVSPLNDVDDAKLTAGIANVGTFCGYPANIVMNADFNAGQVALIFTMLNMDGSYVD